jgi:hypothetical protein
MSHNDNPMLENDQPLTIATIVAILTGDLPLMTEAQLAAMLTEIFLADPSPIGHVLEPLARAELARRQLVTTAEVIAGAA